MKTRVPGHLSLLLVASCSLLVACSADAPPPREAPMQPLVIGTSAPGPAIAVDETVHDAPPASAVAPASPLAVPARDPRLARAPRARALLVAEIQQIDTLLGATTVGSPDRGPIARRLAEDYAELARASDGATATASRKNALKNYQVVIHDAPNDPKIDEAYYYAGLEFELAGDWKNARSNYYDLIKRAPTSRLIPFAYFAFGELFLSEAPTDPTKYDLAEQAYKEVLKFPAPANGMYVEAKRRLAEVAQQSAGKLTRP